MTPDPEAWPRVVVSVVVFDPQGRVLLVRREDDGLWCCPGGHVDPGETVIAAAGREALEEAGVEVEVGRLVGVYSVFGDRAPTPGKHFVALSFLGRVLSGTPRPGGDELEARFFPTDALPPLRTNHRQRISDALEPGSTVVVD